MSMAASRKEADRAPQRRAVGQSGTRRTSTRTRARHAAAETPAVESGDIFPVLPLRGLAVFPGARMPLQIGRTMSLRAVERAAAVDGRVFFCAQRDPQCEEPGPDDLYAVGSVGMLREVRADNGQTVRIVVEGLCRARATGFRPGDSGDDLLLAAVDPIVEEVAPPDATPELAELGAALLRRVERLRSNGLRLPADTALPPVQEPGRLCDAVAARTLHRPADRQEILETPGVRERLLRLHRMLVRETEVGDVEREVAARARKQIERTQREYYLREQLKAIQKELGDHSAGGRGEAEELRGRLADLDLPDAVRERVERELERLDKMPPLAAEGVVVRTYVEWLLAIPWKVRAEDRIDLDAAEQVLAEDHYGLDRIKERVLEHLALRRLSPGPARGAVLCLVGPPGCGKTSLARSIARAMERPFVRLSLGGVRDEAEVRGHRRTYVGAMPGRLVHAMRQAAVRNPVVLLDEIDKMSADYRGDPAAALLEVLDPEQNAAFSDHYLELPLDLSEVMFIATANTLQPLPRALYDRLEVIQLHGYSEDEKVSIARRHLLPRQLRDAGLTGESLRLSDGALRTVIDRYTREAGVRGLERELGSICRKVVRQVVRRPGARFSITERNLARFLGRPHVFHQGAPARDEVGLALGLGWSESGGDVLAIEVSVLPGGGDLQLTGRLGQVMRESALAALTYVRAHAERFGLPADFYRRCEIHVHAPEGAVPKDGPSAGITVAAAMVSALSGRPVRRDVAMTGEITLRGRVLPVGGIKEKVLAARRAGVRRVVLPAENRADWEEIGSAARSGMTAAFVGQAEDALNEVLRGGVPGAADSDALHVPAFLAALDTTAQAGSVTVARAR